jgi:hypothetical protein
MTPQEIVEDVQGVINVTTSPMIRSELFTALKAVKIQTGKHVKRALWDFGSLVVSVVLCHYNVHRNEAIGAAFMGACAGVALAFLVIEIRTLINAKGVVDKILERIEEAP